MRSVECVKCKSVGGVWSVAVRAQPDLRARHGGSDQCVPSLI